MGFKSDIQATNVSLSMTGRNADGDLANNIRWSFNSCVYLCCRR
jgi:hypothetical protein